LKLIGTLASGIGLREPLEMSVSTIKHVWQGYQAVVQTHKHIV
jgi:hypothetical protein